MKRFAPLLTVVGIFGVVIALAFILDLRGAPYPDPELLQAAKNGNTERVRAIIRSGVSVEATNENGETAIFRASMFKHKETLEALLEMGGDVTAEDLRGEGVLVRAVRGGDVEWVKYLIKRGAARKFVGIRKTPSTRVPLHWAAGVGENEIVKVLIEAGISPMLMDGEGMTPLDYAMRARRRSTVRLLEDAVKHAD